MKVLIYEGMFWHGECIPSYCAYFKELGYDVTVVVCEKHINEQALWMLKDSGVSIYTFKTQISKKPIDLKKHLTEIKVPDLLHFDLYFVCTMLSNTYEFIKYLYRKGIKRSQILHQNHRNYQYFLKCTNSDKSLGQNGFILGFDKNLAQLSPIKNLTGDNHLCLENDLEKITLFIGGLSHIHFKNFEKLVKAVEKLNSEKERFQINVTGIRELGNYKLPESKYVRYLGRLNFKDLAYQYIVNDYCFVLFDEKALSYVKDHLMFLDGRVSGSRNMSIMYKIPLVVQKPFQISWGLNDNNSISYTGNDYEKVLLDLLNIKKEKYNSIINNLKTKEQEEFNFCLNNLKSKIEKTRTNKYISTTPFQSVTIIRNGKTVATQRPQKKPRFGVKKRS